MFHCVVSHEQGHVRLMVSEVLTELGRVSYELLTESGKWLPLGSLQILPLGCTWTPLAQVTAEMKK